MDLINTKTKKLLVVVVAFNQQFSVNILVVLCLRTEAFSLYDRERKRKI